jgi:acyl-CoA synthetase (AMP-forming)/AMP-acid ligase II
MQCTLEPLVECSSFIELLRLRALDRDEETRFTFLSSRSEATCLTYAELDRRARAVAALLQSRDAHGECVLLVYPLGPDFIAAFFGCLYAGAIAVPAYPPRFSRNLLRLRAIVADANVRLALTSADLFTDLEPLLDQEPGLKSLQWMIADNLLEGEEDSWREFGATGETLALLQYTSGSTSQPRGVMLTHNNLLHNSKRICEAFECSPEGIGVSWLPPYHDMGLIGGVLQPMYVGGSTVLMSPLTFLQRPVRWLEAISHYSKGKAFVVSGGPNFAYDLCVERVTAEQKKTLDLSKWRVAFTGAEPVRVETLKRFGEAFGPCGFHFASFYPCYGLAEATLMVSGGLRSAPPVIRSFQKTALENNQVVEDPGGTQLAGCGENRPDQRLLVVDPESLIECPPGKVGEIWVSGPSVGRGYWNEPDETEHSFHARVANTGEGPCLRTGDLGFILDGELFITGRLKDLIIVDGRNHYPQDIERSVEQSHPAIRQSCSAAFSIEIDAEERLAILAEVERLPSASTSKEVISAIRRAVTENHELRPYEILLLRTGRLPKTSSGKIQRHACRADFKILMAERRNEESKQ